jgi:hypothetical protein
MKHYKRIYEGTFVSQWKTPGGHTMINLDKCRFCPESCHHTFEDKLSNLNFLAPKRRIYLNSTLESLTKGDNLRIILTLESRSGKYVVSEIDMIRGEKEKVEA